jgi:hypothetical protein
MLTGRPLALLTFACVGLCLAVVSALLRLRNPHRSERLASVRDKLTIYALVCASLALISILLLNLTWTSADLSQALGVRTVTVLGLSLFCSSLAGVVMSLIGSGRWRLLSGATCLLTGSWWFILYMWAAISMGSVQVRHPVKYLVPRSYMGWVRIRYKVPGAPALPRQGNLLICRIPNSGVLATSSQPEGGWATDSYAYYSAEGVQEPLAVTEPGRNGMIWGEAMESEGGTGTADSEVFFVGTEGQFAHAGASADYDPDKKSN